MRDALIVLGMAAVTMLSRLSFLVLLKSEQVPDWAKRALRLVPAAALSALLWPALLYQQGHLDISLDNPRWWAGLVGAIVAWRTGNVVITLTVGMGALLALRWIF